MRTCLSPSFSSHPHSEWRRHDAARTLTFAQLHVLSHDDLKTLLDREDLPKTKAMLRMSAIRLCFMRTIIAAAHSHSMQKELRHLNIQAAREKRRRKSVTAIASASATAAAGQARAAGGVASGAATSSNPLSPTELGQADAQAEIMRLIGQLVPLLQVHTPGLLQHPTTEASANREYAPSAHDHLWHHRMELRGGNLAAPEG